MFPETAALSGRTREAQYDMHHSQQARGRRAAGRGGGRSLSKSAPDGRHPMPAEQFCGPSLGGGWNGSCGHACTFAKTMA